MSKQQQAMQLLCDNGFSKEANRIEREKNISLCPDNESDLMILLALGSVGIEANTTIGKLMVYNFN